MAEWNQCYYCGKYLPEKQITYDHYVPKHKGGEKFVVSCFICNNMKCSAPIELFREWMGVEKFYGELQGWKPW
jgi:HNH endonuclease